MSTCYTPVRRDRNIFAGKPAEKKSLSTSISRHYKVILSNVLKTWHFGLYNGLIFSEYSTDNSRYTKDVLTRCQLYRESAYHGICSGFVKNTGERWLKINV
jgi:hypothetical protein